MKKLFYLSFTVLALLFSSSFIACSDDDDNPPAPDTELKKLIEGLEEMGNVSEFTNVLKSVDGIEIGTDGVTIFAVADATAEKSGEGEEVTKDNIKRHIIEGTPELTDSLVVKSISGEYVAIVVEEDGSISVNGVLMSSANATKVGQNNVYVMEAGLPEADIFETSFSVLECNEEWAEGTDEKLASKGSLVQVYKLQDEQYMLMDSVRTDADGKATLKHLISGDVYYKVEKAVDESSMKTSFRQKYLVLGLFTTQEQLDDAPVYDTKTNLDAIKLGSLRIADITGDGTINASDVVESGYLKVNKEEESTEVTIVSDTYGVSE